MARGKGERACHNNASDTGPAPRTLALARLLGRDKLAVLVPLLGKLGVQLAALVDQLADLRLDLLLLRAQLVELVCVLATAEESPRHLARERLCCCSQRMAEMVAQAHQTRRSARRAGRSAPS